MESHKQLEQIKGQPLLEKNLDKGAKIELKINIWHAIYSFSHGAGKRGIKT